MLDAASNHVAFCLGKEGKKTGEACEQVQEAQAPSADQPCHAQHHGGSHGHTLSVEGSLRPGTECGSVSRT